MTTGTWPRRRLSGVGGDWFDVIPLSGTRVSLVVGEVVGHGIDAAAAMGQPRTAVRTLADLDLPPDELLAHLDDLVGQVAREEQEGEREQEREQAAEEGLPADTPGGDTLPADTVGGEVGTGALGVTCPYVVYRGPSTTRPC